MAASDNLLRRLFSALKGWDVASELAGLADGSAANTHTGAQTFSGAATFTGGATFSTTASTASAAFTFTGGLTVTTANVTITDVDVVLSATTGTKIGTAVGQKLGFHNATPVAQRAGAAQAAVAATAATNVAPYGYAQAQADAIVTLLNEIRAALVEKGIIKGAA